MQGHNNHNIQCFWREDKWCPPDIQLKLSGRVAICNPELHYWLNKGRTEYVQVFEIPDRPQEAQQAGQTSLILEKTWTKNASNCWRMLYMHCWRYGGDYHQAEGASWAWRQSAAWNNLLTWTAGHHMPCCMPYLVASHAASRQSMI